MAATLTASSCFGFSTHFRSTSRAAGSGVGFWPGRKTSLALRSPIISTALIRTTGAKSAAWPSAGC